MDNSINNVSFGAHLSLKNNSLCKHVSKDVANKFAKGTKNIPGTMIIEKALDDSINVTLDRCMDESLMLYAGDLYQATEAGKVSFLKKVAKYINEIIKFKNIESPTNKEINSHIKKLDKIVGNDESSLSWIHNIEKNFLLDQLA